MAEKSLKKQPARGPGNRFEPGRSGNPSGKPKGARSKSTIFGERIMQADADAIVQAVVDAAKGSDPTAMRLCVERLIPVRKGRPIEIDLPEIDSAADVAKAFGVIAKAMSIGKLTPDEANAAASVLEMKRKAIETTELEARVQKLESAGRGRNDCSS